MFPGLGEKTIFIENFGPSFCEWERESLFIRKRQPSNRWTVQRVWKMIMGYWIRFSMYIVDNESFDQAAKWFASKFWGRLIGDVRYG